jgi:uncharacterized protein (DUF736 family)
MNIGSFARNATGHIVGKVSTLTVDLNIGLKPIRSDNPNAPKFEILALSAARQWVRVGAFFEVTSRERGIVFLQGTIEDPSFAQPLYVTAFRQDDGSYNVVWSRPTRRRGPPSEMTAGDDSLPPLPGQSNDDAGSPPADGLGSSTLPSDDFASGPAEDGAEQAKPSRSRKQRVMEPAE